MFPHLTKGVKHSFLFGSWPILLTTLNEHLRLKRERERGGGERGRKRRREKELGKMEKNQSELCTGEDGVSSCKGRN